MAQSEYLWKGMAASDEPVSFTDAGDLSKTAKPTGEQGMAEGEAEQKESQDKGPGGSSESAEKTKTRKKKKKKRKTKKKRKRDRYEPQNFLLRIEGTLCCASIVIGFVWASTMFLALLACLVWANFSMSATIQSAKEEWAS